MQTLCSEYAANATASSKEMTVATVREQEWGRRGGGVRGGGARDNRLLINPMEWFQIINMNNTD